MKTRNKLITVTAISLLFSGAVLAANMTELQIRDTAVKALPGATIETVKLAKTNGHDLWNVKYKGKDGKEATMYFSKAGQHVDATGKAVN